MLKILSQVEAAVLDQARSAEHPVETVSASRSHVLVMPWKLIARSRAAEAG